MHGLQYPCSNEEQMSQHLLCYATGMMKYILTRMSHPLRGLRYAFTRDSAIIVEAIMAAIGLPLVYVLFDLTIAELLLLTFCWFFVMVAELQNSAIEVALTKVHPEHDEEIGRSKDLAAAAVVWASLFGLICLVLIVTDVLQLPA